MTVLDPWASASARADEHAAEVTRLCAITDMAGCTFGSVMMPTLIPAVIQSVQIFINYYPFIVGQLHVVNCQTTIARIFRRALTSVLRRPEGVPPDAELLPVGAEGNRNGRRWYFLDLPRVSSR